MFSSLHICSCLGHMDQAVLSSSFAFVLDGAQGKESWVGAQPKPCTAGFPALSWVHCKCQWISPACSAPLQWPSLASYQPWVKRLNHRDSPPRKESPPSSWPHCIGLLLFVPFAVPVWRCSCCFSFFCTSVVVDGLQTAISWTPALCYKLDDFALVITDINWTLLCWAL